MSEHMLLGGVSVETLCAVLAASVFVADCVMSEASQAAVARVCARGDACDDSRDGWSASGLRHAERMRARVLARCVSRARQRRIMRIRGRR